MNNGKESKLSPMSRTVKCEGQDLHVDIYEDGEGQWLLAVTNINEVTTHWTEPFKTEWLALKEAMKTIKEEGLEGFHMDQPYKHELH